MHNLASRAIQMPKHLAIIMDGNGRWASNKSLPRVAGHKAGVDIVKETINYCNQLNIKHLSLFAFSTENWSRPEAEVTFIMHLLHEMITKELQNLNNKNISLNFWGNLDPLPLGLKQLVLNAENSTKHNLGMKLNIALNYGGRWDIVNAVKSLIGENTPVELIDENAIRNKLMPQGQPDPDLLIRTSGEYRLSNFLLWHLAYTEFYFTDVLWPDFTNAMIDNAIYVYQNRKRRYGGVAAEQSTAEQILQEV